MAVNSNAPSISSKTTVLCHGCLTSHPYPLPFSCKGKCKTFRYCSEECREEDWTFGGHSWRCHFIQMHCMSNLYTKDTSGIVPGTEVVHEDCESSEAIGKESSQQHLGRVQIACDDISFPEYYLPPSVELDSRRIGEDFDALVTDAKPTGKEIMCRVGDRGTVVVLPHQIDAAGSLLLRLDVECSDTNASNNVVENRQRIDIQQYQDAIHGQGKIILCDVFSLESPSSLNISCLTGISNISEDENCSKATQRKSEQLWFRGVFHWFENDLLKAMELFEQSIECFEWRDEYEHDFKDNIEAHFRMNNIKGPPLRRAALRTKVARRCHFLGMCLNDYKCTEKACKYLVRALRAKLRTDPFTETITELILLFEEANDMVGARKVAQWSIDQGLSHWHNIYQRPGFVSSNVDSSAPSFYPNENTHEFPSWCNEISAHFDVIKHEFSILMDRNTEIANQKKSGRESTRMKMKRDKPPNHWPQVGGSHRTSGRDDHKVVAGGDWREMVLFGSGECPHAAPKTRELIRRYAPDAVSLCNAGGGEIIFSVLAPHTHISPHCASTNIRLTAHLGLMIPKTSQSKKCAIRVEDEWHEWREGSFLVFDDSYEHEVINETDECRAVLLMRFWHPSICPTMRMSTMQDILSQRELSEKIRYIPPLPSMFQKIEKRGLGYSTCFSCSQTSCIKAKLVGNDGENFEKISFTCSCGAPIKT